MKKEDPTLRAILAQNLHRLRADLEAGGYDAKAAEILIQVPSGLWTLCWHSSLYQLAAVTKQLEDEEKAEGEK